MKLSKNSITLAIAVISLVLIWFIFANPAHVRRGAPPKTAAIAVEVQTIKPSQFTVELASFGRVKPRTQSKLVAQVSGQVNWLSEHLRPGGQFKQGELLLTIDDSDYQAEVTIAKANVASAEQALVEEQAKVAQAKLDWQRLSKQGSPSPLVLREPQLANATAQLASAKARLVKAELALERTKITAPFSGKVLTKQVDIGQVVSPNSALAEIFATDYIEIRLPINNVDLAYLVTPEQTEQTIKVTIHSQFSTIPWQGKLVRTESSIDEASQQLYVVAQIDSPFQTDNQHMLALKIGEYVTATIEGKTLTDAILIPNQSIYQGSYVYLYQQGKVLRQNLHIAWQNDKYALIDKGLTQDQTLVLTPLGQVSSGTQVQLLDKAKNKYGKRPVNKVQKQAQNTKEKASFTQANEQGDHQ